jgi:hypothetical protein
VALADGRLLAGFKTLAIDAPPQVSLLVQRPRRPYSFPPDEYLNSAVSVRPHFLHASERLSAGLLAAFAEFDLFHISQRGR